MLAAKQFEVDIVALSFSDHFPVKKTSGFLKQLRHELPSATMIWDSGAGLLRLTDAGPGVQLITRLDRIAESERIDRGVPTTPDFRATQ